MDTRSQAETEAGQGREEDTPATRDYTLQELASLWDVSVKSVRRYVVSGELPAIREPHGKGWTYRVTLPEGAPRFVGRGRGGAKNVRRVRDGVEASPRDPARALVDTLQRAFTDQARTVQVLTDDLRTARDLVAELERKLGAAEERVRTLEAPAPRRSLLARITGRE